MRSCRLGGECSLAYDSPTECRLKACFFLVSAQFEPLDSAVHRIKIHLCCKEFETG